MKALFSSQVVWACTEIGGQMPGEYYNVNLVAHLGKKEFVHGIARHVPKHVADGIATEALFLAYGARHADH